MNPISWMLYLWIGLTLPALLIILSIRFREYRKTKTFRKLELDQLISIALASYATLSSLNLIYQAFTVPELHNLLGIENIPALVLGGFAIIWVSLKEFWKLL